MNLQKLSDTPIKSLDDVLSMAQVLTKKYGPYRVCLSVGDDVCGLGGLALAKNIGMVEPYLVGKKKNMKDALEKLHIKSQGWHIIEEKDYVSASQRSAKMVVGGKADILMRGKLLAREFFQALLDDKMELKQHGTLWSNVVIAQVPTYKKLLFLTDCAVVVKTDIPGRLKMIENVIKMTNFMGLANPKIALLAAVETISVGMPISMEEAIIAKMAERGQFSKGVMIDGPLSLDLAVNEEAVKKKGFKSNVAGDADVLILNNIGIGNILFKSLITLCNAKSASVIAGMPFPTVLTSRSEAPENIIYSIALAILMAGPKS